MIYILYCSVEMLRCHPERSEGTGHRKRFFVREPDSSLRYAPFRMTICYVFNRAILYLHKISRAIKKPVINIKSRRRKFIRKQKLIKTTWFDKMPLIVL